MSNLVNSYKGEKKMSEWLPIETAPRDGTWILVYVKEVSDDILHTIMKYDDMNGWIDDHQIQWPENKISYWMPLPEKPKKKHECHKSIFTCRNHEDGKGLYLENRSGIWVNCFYCPLCGEKA